MHVLYRLQALSEFKQTLRETTSVTQEQAGLSLCRAVHSFHFQLLVLLGFYVKLVDMLQAPLQQRAVSVHHFHAYTYIQ